MKTSKKSASAKKTASFSKKTAAPRSGAKSTAKSASGSKAKSDDSKSGGRMSEFVDRVKSLFDSSSTDIVSAIKKDHEGLRNFLGLLKDTDKEMTERRRAYDQFSALLKSHTTAEENVVYAVATELTGRDLHIKTAEGFVEHQLAEDLMKRIERAKTPLEWSAHCNVLSEIVEHHLKEEERDLLPLLDKKASKAENAEMVESYFSLREKTQPRTTKKNAGVLESAR